jgi:hypothetical protein
MGIADFIADPVGPVITRPAPSNTALVTEPGVYDLNSDAYHSDPTPEPSLSAGMITDLLIAPAKCRENSRRLNPDWQEPEGQEKFTIGTVSHVMFLEPHLFDRRVLVVPHDDWRTKEAKTLRERAKADGRTAILAKHMSKVMAAREKFLAHGFTRQAFANGHFEQSMFWRHPIYGFWCRSRPDFYAEAGAHLNDYKATGNADPREFGRHAYRLGYHRRAAWYLEGMKVLFGTAAQHYWFVSQEIKAPYLTAVCELDWQALEAGQAENDYAAGIFDQCLRSGEWYGYRDPLHLDTDRAFRVTLPNYAYYQIDERLGRDREVRALPMPAASVSDETDYTNVKVPPEFDEVF